MRKIFLYIFIILLCSNAGYSNEKFNTWGMAGTTCGEYNRILKEYPENGLVAAYSAFQGFLTGYNLSFPLNQQKIVNYQEFEYVENFINEYCRSNGKNSKIWEGLIEYFKSLPSYE
tara:strand:+ start:340 stop:687 length:348 start_codon:yes stop_codon:yes gene_type:complete